jgi:hypothetical protein
VMWSELGPGAWTRYWYQVSMYYYDALSSYWRLGIEESLKIIMPLWSALPARQGTGVVPFSLLRRSRDDGGGGAILCPCCRIHHAAHSLPSFSGGGVLLFLALVAVCSEVWSAIVSCWLAGGCVWVVLASRVVRVSPAQTGVRDVT